MVRALLILLLGTLTVSPVGAAEEDAVKKALDAAKAKYTEDLEKYKKEVADWFEAVEGIARKDGKKSLVDQIKEERSVFTEYGDLPPDAPARLRKRRTDTRTTLESAYRTAIKDYLKAKKDAEAGGVEKELTTFNEERAGVEAAHAKTLVGTWKITIGDWSSDFTFNADGTVFMQNSKGTGGKPAANFSGRWVVDMKQQAVIMTWSDKHQYRFDLPLDPKLVTGSNHLQNKLEAVKKR